ncbi:MAG: EAL domain-containing protein [Acidimicrobiales bacterium]|nr:EAL domain-containing protein [Acidimicrobiales bacterium]MCB9392970.1 EAL domain-containing protein [Acidimicrobiaceae bacterium]
MGMLVVDVSTGTILAANGVLIRLAGQPGDRLVGRRAADLVHADDRSRHLAIVSRVASGLPADVVVEQRLVRTDGRVVWTRWSMAVAATRRDPVLVAHVQDVTAERRRAEALRWAATHDELTRLPNRAQLTAELTARLAARRPGTGVMFLDLDHFKVVNDSLGHAAGDRLLRVVTRRLCEVLGERDVLGRFGGDEFVALLSDHDGDRPARAVAERLRHAISRPVVVDGVELVVTASIGIAMAGRDDVAASDLLRDADAAMYRAKAAGRDRVEVFLPSVHRASVATLRTTNELRRGIERDELVPYFQPILDLPSGRLAGFEVLARWRHPERGLLGAEQFVPTAEEAGIIGDVDAAILRASVAQLGRWRSGVPAFHDLTIAVNVSSRQLLDPRFVDVVRRTLAAAEVPSDALWLELTETTLMADVTTTSNALRRLREAGVHIAVDDFGTGYSSLSYLKRFPVEAIKVDRSFVGGLGVDDEDTTIVDAVIRLGHSLGLHVVSEGVETDDQLGRLQAMGCDRAQGFLFGRPRPAEIVEADWALV